jgi:2-dehydropantoate 2-reductase
MTKKLKNIVVVGQGAMGLLWYHHLSQGSSTLNINITLLASNQNSRSISELKSAEYQFTAYQQEHTSEHCLSYSQIADIKSADVVILCLKSFHIVEAVKKIAQDISSQCIVILAHNGMGTAEAAAKSLPCKQVILAMLTTHGCLRDAPLAITHTGLGQSDIGLLSGELDLSQQRQLCSLLNNALPQVTYHQNIVQKQWLKLAINCVINPITAINNIDNGEVNNERFTQQIDSLLDEIVKISQVEKIDLVFNDLQTTVHKVAQSTAKNCSSMRSDVLAGRATEIDCINGYIHRLGQKYKIATPENTRLWQQVLNIETLKH